MPLRFFLLLVLLAPGIANANAGVPMLALAWPVQWLALIPVVFIEVEVMRRMLDLNYRPLLISVAKANFKSTLIGIPLAWLAMLLLEFIVGGALSALPTSVELPRYVQYALFPFMAAWVWPSTWGIFLAYVVLVVPFCIVSIRIEERSLAKAWPDLLSSSLHLATVRANVISYGLLSLLAVLYPLLVDAK